MLKELGRDDGYETEVDGEKVFLPSPNLNALLLLRHMLNHFAAIGMTLRQLLDWGFFWEKNGDKVDKDWLKLVLENFNMIAFFNIINAICVDDLGFDSRIFPQVQYLPELKERVLQDTLFPVFDNVDALRPGLIRRVVFKYKRWKTNAWKREFCYGESSMESFWWSVRMHILKPSSI